MATIKNTTLFTALSGAITQILSDENGYQALSVIKANFKEGTQTKNYVDSFAYGEYSLANIAQVSNTVSELAKHIYNHFIPNDRIIPSKKSDNQTDIIFYKKINNAYDTMTDTISGKAANYKNYIVTGQNLYNNIKYHKPFINNTQDYNESNYFVVPTGISASDTQTQNGRVGSAYIWNSQRNADWYRTQVSSEAPATGKTAANDYSFDDKVFNIKINNTLSGTGLSSNKVTVLSSNFELEEFTFTSAGLTKSVNKSDGFNVKEGETLVNVDTSFNVLLYPSENGDVVKKTTLTFNKYGLLIKYTIPTETSYKLMHEGNTQEFTGLKTFKDGVGLPGGAGDLVVG
jgi:hypothetical protein